MGVKQLQDHHYFGYLDQFSNFASQTTNPPKLNKLKHVRIFNDTIIMLTKSMSKSTLTLQYYIYNISKQ